MNKGKKELVRSVDVEVKKATWYRLGVHFVGPEFSVRFNGKEVLSLKDKVNLGSGKIGFFTTADTIVAFDDLEVESNTK